MEILKAGTRVKTSIGSIEAFIVEVSIAIEVHQYKLRYFTNGVVTECWLYRFEIELATKKQPAGFNKSNNDVILIQ